MNKKQWKAFLEQQRLFYEKHFSPKNTGRAIDGVPIKRYPPGYAVGHIPQKNIEQKE